MSIVTLSGENSFAIDQRIASVTADFVNKYGDFAIERVDAQVVSLDQVIDIVRALPFLSDKKLVIVKDPLSNIEIAEGMERLINAVAHSTELVFILRTVDKRNNVFKLLQKTTTYEVYNSVDFATLVQQTILMFSSRGIKITKSDVNYLITKTGQDLLRIAQEVQKLSNYSNVIARSDIDALVHQSLQSKVFDLVEAVFRGDQQSSLRLYQEQRLQKVEPQAIFGIVVWQLSVVVAIAATPSEKQNQLSELGLSTFVAKKGNSIVRRAGKASVMSAIRLLAKLDTDIKLHVVDADYAMRYFISRAAWSLNQKPA
jgi:DNA polymerase-3 subunit delta